MSSRVSVFNLEVEQVSPGSTRKPMGGVICSQSEVLAVKEMSKYSNTIYNA